MTTGDRTWKPLELVKVTAEYLVSKQVPNPRLDAELLMVATLGLKDRCNLYAGFEREISGKELAGYRELVRRRAAREPVSRILGRREFMGINFQVTPDVFSPRPETELLVETALDVVRPGREKSMMTPGKTCMAGNPGGDGNLPEELIRALDMYGADADETDLREFELPQPIGETPLRHPPNPPERRGKASVPGYEGPILDLGTGSGCVAVALAALLPAARVIAVDASAKALGVAGRNAAEAGVADRVEFRQGDWFGGCRSGETFALILSNPPYLVDGDPDIWPEVSRYDPPAALYAGGGGLDCFRRIIPPSLQWLAPGGRIFLEVGAGQAAAVTGFLRNAGYIESAVVRDYGGMERVVTGMAPAAG
ncbi:MAG: peptide chain release factor N(5)-glutamine methyltransferase [Planctomycetota bacterium]|nr:peptide chain release factor N(5)-glutamine methyltransferase [Planctomycetota bacterium]